MSFREDDKITLIAMLPKELHKYIESENIKPIFAPSFNHYTYDDYKVKSSLYTVGNYDFASISEFVEFVISELEGKTELIFIFSVNVDEYSGKCYVRMRIIPPNISKIRDIKINEILND